MDILELIQKLFGDYFTEEQTVIDHWKIYELPHGYTTTLRLEELFKQYEVYGRSNQGEKLIIASNRYVIIKYPPVTDKRAPIILAVREDNLRPCFLNDMSEEADFEGNRTAPKLAYGYVWRSQNREAIEAFRTVTEELDAERTFKDYEADVKSWTLIESTMLNKQDAVPQIRNSFKPYIKVETENGLLLTFPSGFIAIDKYANITMALDYRVATGALDIITMATSGDVEAVRKLVEKLRIEIISVEGSYFAFEEATLETAVLSSIGNSI